MKIIGISNFDNASMSDILVAENVLHPYGERIVRLLNEYVGVEASRYYKLVEDNKALYEFAP